MFKIQNKFYLWWATELFIGTGLFWAWYFGLVDKVWSIDITMLTTIIFSIFVVTNVVIGYVSYQIDNGLDTPSVKSRIKYLSETCWFLSEQMMALGMLGTVIGLIHMLAVNLISGGGADIAAAQSVINDMWAAMGLALYTNVVGLAASIITKIQVYFVAGRLSEA